MTGVELVKLGLGLVVVSAVGMGALARKTGAKVSFPLGPKLDFSGLGANKLLGIVFWVLATAQVFGGYLLLVILFLGLLKWN